MKLHLKLWIILTIMLPGFLQAQELLHLQKNGNAGQLIVDGKPHLILGGELHKSISSSVEYLQPAWSQLKEMDLNTVLTVLSWQYLMKKWPDPGFDVVTERSRTRNLWTRAVYYEGLMALYEIKPEINTSTMPLSGESRTIWGLRFGLESRHADPLCAGQTYLYLYEVDPKPERIKGIKTSIDYMMET